MNWKIYTIVNKGIIVKYKEKENMAAAMIKTNIIGTSNTVIAILRAFDFTLDRIQLSNE
jgi:hypothetical protein